MRKERSEKLEKSMVKRFRYLPALMALVSVDEYMGIPRFLSEEILFLPFFTKRGELFALSEKIYMEYPSCCIVKYEKVRNHDYRVIPEGSMKLLKRRAEELGFRYAKAEMPESLVEWYDDDLS